MDINAIPKPARIAKLPLDPRGYPIPWFVSVAADLRFADGRKKCRAFQFDLCWVCGEKLLPNVYAFVGGPLSVRNRIFGDWASHVECAEYSVKACPFINGTMTKRRDTEPTHPDLKTHTGDPTQLYHVVPYTAIVVAKSVEKIPRREIFEAKKIIRTIWYKAGEEVTAGEVQGWLEETRYFQTHAQQFRESARGRPARNTRV